MSSGAKIITFIATESTPGEIPADPVWQTARLTGNTMTPSVNVEQSDEIRDTRMGGGSIITSLDYQGDLSFEFSAITFDDLLEAAFYGTWDADVLEVGEDRHTFTVVKGYRDAGVWATFTGAHVSQMSLEIPEEGKVTGTFSLMAMGSDDGTTDPTSGDTINPATTTVPMGSATSVGDIEINDTVMAGQACISALTLNIDNTLQVQRCLGQMGPGRLIETRANIAGQVTMAWSADAYALWSKMLTREAVKLVFPLHDAAGNTYTFEIPAAELDGDLPDAGNEDLVQVQLDLTAKLSPVKITRSLA